jgi:CheY-like chemotaxis protein
MSLNAGMLHYGRLEVLESSDSVCVDNGWRTEQPDTRKSLVIWDSPDTLKIGHAEDSQENSFRVLLAEDNPLDQVSIRRLLEKQGLDVSLASDGRRAVEMYEAGEYDLVLLDILMPEMDGFEVASKIREHEQTTGNRIPLIALTAYSLKAVYDKCRSVGMNGYLSKPVAGSDLRSLCSVLMPVRMNL